MASLFRKRIATQVVSTILPFLERTDKILMYDTVPKCLKLCQHEGSNPRFVLFWKDLMKVKPDLMQRVHPTSVITYLKNQNFPTAEGIHDIILDEEKKNQFSFTVDQELFTSTVLLDICYKIENLASRSCYFKTIPPENVIVEFSSPNIAKPFHYGHFRSTILGNIWANICKYVGHDVTKINYVGDWGLQYGILAAGFDTLGSEEKLNADPLTHLHEVYKESNAKIAEEVAFKEKAKKYFQMMENGDEKLLEQWKIFRDLSIKQMNETYKRLNITFDETHSESMYVAKTVKVFEQLLDAGVVHSKDDGCLEASLPTGKEEKLENVVLRKSDGTSLYLSRDVAAAIDRKNTFHFDSLYYVVDSSQSKHFSHLKSILKSLGHSWSSTLHHVAFGRILNFSSRKGSAVFLHDILDEAQDRALEAMTNSPTIKVTENLESVADILGISALIINDACSHRKREYHFSWDKVLSMSGDSAVSLQQCHARLSGIKENCGVELSLKCDFSCLTENEAITLIDHLARFDEAIYRTYLEQEPYILVHYLFGLRHEVGRAIKFLPVKGSNLYLAKARLLLFHASYLVMHKGLQLLGITPLDKM